MTGTQVYAILKKRMNNSTPGGSTYEELVSIIGDLSEAGFGNMTLAEVLQDIKSGICETATDSEVDDTLNKVFNASSGSSTDPGGDTPGNTATDEEVGGILDEVFGKQP